MSKVLRFLFAFIWIVAMVNALPYFWTNDPRFTANLALAFGALALQRLESREAR